MNNTQIKKFYNVIKIVSSKDLPNLVKTYKDNQDLIIVMMKRKDSNKKPPKYFTDFVEQTNKILQQILYEIKEIKIRLDKHDELFRVHGWIK